MPHRFYDESNNLGYGLSSKRDPQILKGRRSIYRPSLYDFADLFLSGIPQAQLGEFANPIQEQMARWGLSFNFLRGSSIQSEDGGAGMINVLPLGSMQYHVYEDAVPEVAKFITTATTKTYSSNAITFELSATDAAFVKVDDIIVNWSNSESKRARVTVVSGQSITVVAFGNSAAAFTGVTDFFTGTTDLEFIHIIGSSRDPRNPSTFYNSLAYKEFNDTTTQKTYNIQTLEDYWEERHIMDGNLRTYAGNRPMSSKNKREAFLQHKKKLSGACLFGKAQDVTASSDRSAFNGLIPSIVTNVTTCANGYLSLSDLDEMLVDKLGVRMSSREWYGLCSWQVLQVLESLFTALAKAGRADIIDYQGGVYGLTIKKVIYKGLTIHLVPISDFTYANENTQTLITPSTSTAAALSTKLVLVDPQAMTFVTAILNAKHNQVEFFRQIKGVENNDERDHLERNVIRTAFGFALMHEKTSGIINNIVAADISG